MAYFPLNLNMEYSKFEWGEISEILAYSERGEISQYLAYFDECIMAYFTIWLISRFGLFRARYGLFFEISQIRNKTSGHGNKPISYFQNKPKSKGNKTNFSCSGC